MKIGFTGSRLGMTPVQYRAVRQLLAQLRSKIDSCHHGDCLGADESFHNLARLFKLKLIIHPPTKPNFRAFLDGDETREPKDYLIRNKEMVDEVDRLIACPHTRKEVLRSGTWATVRYARKKGVLVTIL